MLIHGQTSKLQQTQHTTPFMPSGPADAAAGAGPAASVAPRTNAGPADKFRATASNPFRQVPTQEPPPGLTGMKAGGGCCLPPPKLTLPDLDRKQIGLEMRPDLSDRKQIGLEMRPDLSDRKQIGLPLETGAAQRSGAEIARTKTELHDARKALEQGLDKARNGGVITAQDGEKIRDAQSKIDKLQAELVGLHMSQGTPGPKLQEVAGRGPEVDPRRPTNEINPFVRFDKSQPQSQPVETGASPDIQVNPFEPNPLTQPGGSFSKEKPGAGGNLQVNPFEPNPLTQPGGSFWKEVPPPPLEIRPWLCSGG